MNDIKLVCFDIDNTLIKENSWYTLNLALGITPEEDKEMYDAYFAGTLSYSAWIEKLRELYIARGRATEKAIREALSTCQLSESAQELVAYLKNKGYTLALISGSFDLVADAVGETLGITLKKGNTRFAFNSAGMLTDVMSDGEEKHAKLAYLETLCAELNIPITACACIGDGSNDIEMFKKTERGITFTSAPKEVQEAAWKIVPNLSGVADIL